MFSELDWAKVLSSRVRGLSAWPFFFFFLSFCFTSADDWEPSESLSEKIRRPFSTTP